MKKAKAKEITAKKRATKKAVLKKASAPEKNIKTAKKTAPKKTIAKKAVAKTSIAKKAALKKLSTKPKPAPKGVGARKKAVAKTVATKSSAVAKKPVFRAPTRKPSTPFVEQMYAAVLQVLDERQAEDIVTVDLAGKSSIADFMVIASGRASRQLGAIVQYLREAFFKLGVKSIRVEGLSEGNWVLVDAGDIIIHLFRPEVRSYYNLESIWQNGSVDRSALIED